MALGLTFAPGVLGSSVLTVRATDAAGQYAETSFSVTVTPPAADSGQLSGGSGERQSMGNRNLNAEDITSDAEVLTWDPSARGNNGVWK